MILRWFTATPTFFHSTVTNLDRSKTFTDMNQCNITLITTSAILHPTSLPFCRELDFFPSQTILLFKFPSWSSNLYFGSLDSPYCQWFELERKLTNSQGVGVSPDPPIPLLHAQRTEDRLLKTRTGLEDRRRAQIKHQAKVEEMQSRDWQWQRGGGWRGRMLFDWQFREWKRKGRKFWHQNDQDINRMQWQIKESKRILLCHLYFSNWGTRLGKLVSNSSHFRGILTNGSFYLFEVEKEQRAFYDNFIKKKSFYWDLYLLSTFCWPINI